MDSMEQQETEKHSNYQLSEMYAPYTFATFYYVGSVSARNETLCPRSSAKQYLPLNVLL
jgi:hypothetical protein